MKSPARSLRKLFTAFTLIELLTVIAIIAILMGLLFPAIGAVREAARKAQAKNDETEIVTAVKAYYTEYGKYPIDTALDSGTMDAIYTSGTIPSSLTGSNAVAKMGNNSFLIDVLRYNTGNPATASIVSSTNSTSLNTRQIAFLDVPAVKNSALPASGVIANSGTANIGCWFDPWGSQYNILIDANYDNNLGNPYQDSPGGTPLTTGVVVWSYGKNGQLGGGAAIGGNFTKETGSPGFYYSTPSNSTTATSGDVISWQ